MSQADSDILVFDRKRVQHNRDRAATDITQHDFLANWCMDQIMDRLQDINRSFDTALNIGARTNHLSSSQIQNMISMDLSQRMVQRLPSCIVADEELLPFSQDSFDLIISTLNLHSVNDLPGSLAQIQSALKPDGLFVAALLGGETLHELRHCLMVAENNIKNGTSPRVFPFADKQQIGGLLQRTGFNLPVVDSETVSVTYDNLFKLLHDVRGMGEGNAIKARNKNPLSKAIFMEAAQIYNEEFSESDGKIVATFEVIFMLGWAPHNSQQKPLRPGSAQHSLADALGTKEIKTGERAG